MKSPLATSILVAAALSAASCTEPAAVPFSVIPEPESVILETGVLDIAGASFHVDPAIGPEAVKAIGDFREAVMAVSGKKSSCDGEMAEAPDGVCFRLVGPECCAEEEYCITVGSSVEVTASAFPGFFYAIQTLKQMLPESIYGGAKASSRLLLPRCRIQDKPRFGYRGMHLDSSRHFWSVDEVKRYLDVMSIYKLNRFHWHLTDDQGWRFESRKYPELNETGAYRNGTMEDHDWSSNDGIRYGGLYTQDEMRDIVAYAAERAITIIPEIDLPGHMVAVLAAYPELGCTGGPYEVWTKWGVAKDILCAGNDKTFDFLEGILSEVADVFPSEYIHIGGDECFGGDVEPDRPDPWDVCPKCRARMLKLGIKPGPDSKHQLQNYVTGRVQGILADLGRKVIGWDEILEGDVAPGTTIMSWRGTSGGVRAAKRGLDVIMTPTTYMYFDYQQAAPEGEPLGPGYIREPLTVEKVYSFDPCEGLGESEREHILGAQANLWTEYIATPEHLEYMLLPRMCALSEVQWCTPGNKDYGRFSTSLEHTERILDKLGYNYRK